MMFLTDRLFFDTDCLSSFLWTDQGCLLTQMYPKRIIVPEMVYVELQRVHQPKFIKRLDALLDSGDARRMDVDFGTATYSLFRKMTSCTDVCRPMIDRGEASAIALAKEHSGIVASNNFRDIRRYIHDLKLDYRSTGDILEEAYNDGLLSMEEAEDIWKTMLSEDCWIGADSFREYLEKPHRPLANRQ